MTKYLLVAIVIAVVIFLMRGVRRNATQDRPPPSASGGGDMVRCARCGIHLPRDEAVSTPERFFCSADHEREYRDSRGA